ncbi:MAG: hypothetical protein ACR2PS_13110 [Pseudomonadales bacterium]
MNQKLDHGDYRDCKELEAPIKQRVRAFIVHFLLSLAIVGGLFLLLKTRWFPEPFFSLDGGNKGLTLVAFIDIVVGPLLTFCVYETHKKSLAKLRLDLAIIFALQIGCLCYGVHLLHKFRPASLAYMNGNFYMMSIDVYDSYNREEEFLEKYGDSMPVVLSVVRQAKKTADDQVLANLYEDGVPVRVKLEYYRDIEHSLNDIKKHSVDVSSLKLVEDNSGYLAELNKWKTVVEQDRDRYSFLPVNARYKSVYLVVDNRTGKPVDYIDIPQGFLQQEEQDE